MEKVGLNFLICLNYDLNTTFCDLPLPDFIVSCLFTLLTVIFTLSDFATALFAWLSCRSGQNMQMTELIFKCTFMSYIYYIA